MTTQEKILEILEKNKGVAISGEEVATALNVSRAAIWKAVNGLKEKGYNIVSTTNRGYCLSQENDILSASGIKANILNKDISVIYKESTISTNDDLLLLAQNGCKDTIVEVSSFQQGGKGRLGRTFVSPKGGIYISFLVHFKNLELKDITIITPMAAVAVLNCVKKTLNLDLDIKWVNDLFYKGKKVCGILTQACVDVENSSTSSVVVGIGIDYKLDLNTLPLELQPIVGTLIPNMQNTECNTNKFVGTLIDEMFNMLKDFPNKNFLQVYKDHSIVLGKEVQYTYNNEAKTGLVIDIDDDCALLIRQESGNIQKLNSGEVSIKIQK